MRTAAGLLAALVLLSACAGQYPQTDELLEDVVKTPSERCQEAKDIIADFTDPTTGEYALAVAVCMP